MWYVLNLTVLTEAEPRSILSNSVNITPYLLRKKSITVLLCSETIYERYICSNLWSHVQNTNAFSYALLWRVVYSSQFHCLTSRYFGTLIILTGKAEAKDFAVLIFIGNVHFQWKWSDNFWSRDSAPPMAVWEKHRLYNNIQLWTFYSVNMVWYLLNLTVLTEASPPRSMLSNSVNIRSYLLSKMSITVLLYSETIHERYMYSNLWSHVKNTNAFTFALICRVMYSPQFYYLTSRYFGALSIFTGKADANDFAVLVFTGNAYFQWIWPDNIWSRDSAPPMAVGEKHRLYNKMYYETSCVFYIPEPLALLSFFLSHELTRNDQI